MTESSIISSAPTFLFHLAAAGELKEAATIGRELPAQVNDLPAFYYWKDAIVVGSYIHPAGKFSLDITRDKLDGYADTFAKMKSNGVSVPILMDHAQSAAATLGWIIDVQRRDDRLMELHQFLGESARDIGLRNKVSLGIDPDFIDGKGHRYGEAIVHSAVTPVPVVPNQGAFERISLGDEREVITLSLAPAEEDDVTVTQSERSTFNAQPIGQAQGRLPTSNPQPPDIRLALTALADAAAAKRDLAVARGGIDAAVADELFALLVEPDNAAHNTLLLSRNGSAPIALAVFDALARNKPVPLGEATQLQILSRQVPGLDPELLGLQEKMIALASGKAHSKT